MDNISTGWFGIPGRQGGQVHLVRNRKPLCGQRIHPKAEYFCNAPFIIMNCVECQRCKKRGLPLVLADEIATLESQLQELSRKTWMGKTLLEMQRKHIQKQINRTRAFMESL